MFQVRTMRTNDFLFATKLANTMNWNMAVEDFEFMVLLEPNGCFVALDGVKRVGIASCIRFGSVGWFGDLIVKEEYRKRGVGSLLVRHALEYLISQGAKTVGLYAYPDLVGFYANLGFRSEVDFSVLEVKHLGHVQSGVLLETGKDHLAAIEAFDRSLFGSDRARLLESIILEDGNLCYCCFEGGKMVGYVAATVYEKMAWIGPLICQPGKSEVAISLVQSVLSSLRGLSVYSVVAKKETALLDAFLRFGFVEAFSVSRMFLGEISVKNCIYLAESLERG